MHPINGNALPPRPDLRRFGYAPGNYMGTCQIGKHTMQQVDKRATCCLTCAENQLARYGVNTEMTPKNPPKGEPVPAHLEQYTTGKLTAMQNTAVAMTVEGLDLVKGEVKTARFVGANLVRESYKPSTLIGAGDELVFAGGAFVRAQ